MKPRGRPPSRDPLTDEEKKARNREYQRQRRREARKKTMVAVDRENFETYNEYQSGEEHVRDRKKFYKEWQKEVKNMDDVTMQKLASASPFEYHPEDYNQNSASDMHLYW